MKEGTQGFTYNPHSSFSTPFTIISQTRQIFTSKPISLPCLYEVYCPYSCKRIKVGLSKDNKIQALQFNTTSNRTVSFYANDNIRYLVNKHRPNKKDKKTITGQGWAYHIEVQDKGNMAIFNPYCFDPLQPLSFYTLQKIGSIDPPKEQLKFSPKIEKEAHTFLIGRNPVYLSKDKKWLGLNKYFDEQSSQQITIINPKNNQQQITIKTSTLIKIVYGYLNHYYGELQKIYTLQNKDVQYNQTYKLTKNIDQIYEEITFYLNILEQVRARLMNDSCYQAYKQYFKEHPCLYSSLQRLTSFLNYGNTKYDVVRLAQIGYYNKSDMLQDLAYIQLPQLQIPSFEQQNIKDEVELTKKLFPFSRYSQNLPFPNISLNTSLTSMHPQLTTSGQILKHATLNPYLVTVDNKAKIVLWSCEMMVYKMIEIDISVDYQQNNLAILKSQADINNLPLFQENQVTPNTNKTSEKNQTNQVKTKQQQIKPDQNLLKQLQLMGYSTSLSKKALIQAKNQQLDVVLDIIAQLSAAQVPKKNITKPWNCLLCTYHNSPSASKCEMCGQEAPDEQQQIIALLQAQRKILQQIRKKQEEQKVQKQKQQQQRIKRQHQQGIESLQKQKRNKILNGAVKSIAIYRNKTNNIDPFFISVLLQLENSQNLLKTFRVGLSRKSLLKFYRIEDQFLVSNFTRQIIYKKDFQSINKLIQNSRNQIQWGIKFFESSSENAWTVINSVQVQIQGSATQIKYYNDKLYIFDNNTCKNAFDIQLKDSLDTSSFTLQRSNSLDVPFQILTQNKNNADHQMQKMSAVQPQKIQRQIIVNQKVEQVCIKVIESLQPGQWKNIPKNNDLKIASPIYAQNLIMSQFLPLKVQSYQGSIFSHKYSCNSMLQKNNDKNNVYVSNYPNVSFAFKLIDNKPMFVEAVTIISKNQKMNKIYPISSGLIFTANQLSWFTVAKQKFANFTKQQYESWLKYKQVTGQTVAFWQPVAYFDLVNQVQFQVNFKRVAKYIFLLPTSVSKKQVNDDVIAVKIDFFGVKGRVEEEIPDSSLLEQYKNQGLTQCRLQLQQENANKEWINISSEQAIIESAISANSLNFAPKYLCSYAQKIPLNTTSIFKIKFKNLNNQKKILLNAKNIKSIYVLSSKQATNSVQKYQITSFAQLSLLHGKLSNNEIQQILDQLNLNDLILYILKGPSDITSYQNLLTKILTISNFDRKILTVMSEIIVAICDPNIEVTEVGFKSFMRFYQKIMSLDQSLSKQTIQKTWIETIQFCQKVRNKNYNILRNSYKIQQLILQPALFSKDYYRLIHPNYVDEQKQISIAAEPHTPVNNRAFIDVISNFNYIYYIDLLGHENITSLEFYFPKITGDNRYKISMRITQLNEQDGQVNEKQIYYRYFHEDYLLQLSQKAFRDTQIFTKTQINYCSIPGSLISSKTRVLKLYFNLLILTAKPSLKLKLLNDPYLLLPIITSNNRTTQTYAENPFSTQIQKMLSQFPTATKHNSIQQRMPPHKYSHQNKKLLYIIHQFKNKNSSVEVKAQSMNKIQKIIQNILDKNIVSETVSTIKVNDYIMNYKGLDFGYTFIISLYKIFRKLTTDFKVNVKLMFMLFDAFIVYECGPIKNQTAILLTQLYNRLTTFDKNLFATTIIDNYLIDTQKIRSLKISEKYPSQKIIKFLGQLNLPMATLFQKLSASTSVASITILILLITHNYNKTSNPYENLQVYNETSDQIVKTMQISQLIKITYQVCNWIIINSSGLSSEILELGLNLLLGFLSDKSGKVSSQQIKKFVENLSQEEFWQLVFGTIRKRNDMLNDKIDTIFKVLVENITQNFQKGVNNMLLQIIKKDQFSLYERINPNVDDDARMGHLKTILQYLSLTNKKIFLDADTAISLLQLPLTTTLWSLALKIIPRQDKILIQIIKQFPKERYNSLGNQIMQFCEPLAGIKKMQSNHINWLDLVRKIRLQGRSLFELFIQKLKVCNFGGRYGLTMALNEDVVKLQIADQFAKLITENKIQEKSFTQQSIDILVSWFFMNYNKQKGSSPATDILFNLSKNVLTIFERITGTPSIIPKFMKKVLQVKKQGQIIQNLFEQKRISSSNAIDLNKRFSQCFELLINLLCVNDELFNYFAFEIDGLKYVLQKAGLQSQNNSTLKNLKSTQGQTVTETIPQQEYLISEGLITSAVKDSSQSADKAPSQIQLKQQQIATNVLLVPNKNAHSITSTTTDWTVYKKANKTKIIFLPMNGATYHEFPLYITFAQACQVRSIKIGFPAASYQFNDKLVASPSCVILEGGMDLKNLQSMGEMQKIDDQGYTCNGVRVFVLNFQKTGRNRLKIRQAIQSLPCFRIKYLKIIVKRPVISFIQGQYSPLNGKPYTNLGSSISFLSVLGDNFQKRKLTLLNFCKQISKSSALTILGTVINQTNSKTVKHISNSQQFITNFKNKFNIIQQHMVNYPNIVPNIIYSLGSSNQQLGDWIINKFLSQGNSDNQAKLLNQIVVSSSKRIYIRLDIFLIHILNKIRHIVTQSDIQANIKYSQSLFFIQSFCKTLQQSYDFNIEVPTVLHCTFKNIQQIITLYDRKYSSPEIKTFSRLLINLLYLQNPLQLSEQILNKTLNLIWQNCSQAKPYFYDLLATLLVNKKNKQWIQQNNHQKIKSLANSIYKSISSNSQKILNSQLFLFWILSYHQKQYILAQKIHLDIYNKIKVLLVTNYEIYDNLVKLIHNVLLDNDIAQRQMALQLIEDVDLLVQRRDQNLQQLYVGILRLQKQINVNIKGFDVDSRNNKKDSLLTSSILNKVHIKAISQKINKKIKFNLILELNQGLKPIYYDKFYSAINASQFLLVFKVKLTNGKYGYIGCYSPGKSFRSEEDSYCWEDVINYEKGSFIFYINQGETKFIESTENTQHMLSLFGGQDQMDQSLILYDKNSQIFKLIFSNPNQCTFNLPNFTGAKVQSIQVFNGLIRPSTMQPKLLATSSKAPVPFNYYRTSNLYVFPYRITVQKFMSIIGIKGKCHRRNKKIQPEQILGNLSEQSNDFIADISIQVQQNGDNGKQDQGYFPVMKIFDKFSDLGGVNKVLQIGSKSIKDWRKPQRRKCFEHYMSELRNFVHLPSFFNHYIKNQQSITFLFQVASGMPDDPNSEKNWQQEQVKSSKFIYKILADIYKYDKSLLIRDINKYSQFCELILQKLAEISKQTIRSCKQHEGSQSPQVNKQVKQAQKQKNSATNAEKKKKKGIGYSSDNQNTSKWTASQWLQYRKNMNEEIQRVASIFVSFLDCERPLTDEKLAEIIKNSCLLPLIESALRSGSLLDISKEADLFRSYLNIIKSLANNPATVSCLLEIDPKYKPSQTQSIYKLLTKLHGIAQIFIDCLKSGKANQQNQVAAVIATQIEKVYSLVDKAVKNLSKNTNVISIKQINSMPTAEAYRLLLSGLRFGYVDMKRKQDYVHFYSSTIPKGSPPTAKILRLSQQLADLSSSLPCQHTNSIFVRCDKSRIDVIKILIMGSKDTPYSNGAFMFDLFCDDSYPNNPPKMSITTTGNGKIRFNPNLYSCGKVCLSLLGTWRGQASQNWDAKISTLLQLFISTQGITMSQDLYFNEPGFDSQQGTVQGEKKNEAYSNIVKLGNVRYAMIDQIKNPPKGFQDVVNRHFYIKRQQILEQIQKWVEQADKKQASYIGLVNDHNTTWCTQLKVKGKYKQLLQKQYQQLKNILQKLPEPNLVQPQEQSTVIETQKIKKKIKAKQVKLGQIDVSYQPQAQKQLEYEQNVMQDRWSRYIGAMGIQAVKKQAQSKVILIGLKTLGLQIAKNLVLSGLKQLCIVDHGEYQNGTSQHFYMSDIKSKKIQDCIYKIKQLNPYMLVKCVKQIPNIQSYNIVISTESLEKSKELSIKCRKLKIKFIHAQTCGVSGLYFADLGQQFLVQDKNGEQSFEGLIKQISVNQDGTGVVRLLDGVKHPYQDGDYIVLDKVQGMKQIQSNKMEQPSVAQVFYNKMSKTQYSHTINGKVFKIKVINWNSFEIGDIKNYSPYVKGGLCRNINIPQKLQFKPLQECIKQFDKFVDPSLGIYDFEKMGDNYAIFACFQAYTQFVLKNKRKPKNWSLQDSEQFQSTLKKILENDKKSEQQTQSIIKFGRKYSLIAEAEIPVISAYFGGLVSQQIIKTITNKYTPIKQFFTFHFNQLIQQIPQDTQKFKDLQIKQNQNFSNLKIVVGRDNSKKIEEMKTFVIGAGAIGCQLLKNFAMVNMGAQGMITITDPDHIQTSNLTRQFLFRQKHVKKPKSATAAATLIQMNPLLKNHISARLDKVSEQTEDIYSDQFFQAQTVVANALDNVKARVYVDSRCVINSKSLFESGTLGPKGHVQVIVPHKTQNYGNQNDPTQENQIPHCTLKMFPQETVHCIEWSRDIFGKVFTLNPKALKKVIQAKDLSAAEGQEKVTISKMIEYKPQNFDDCVAEAVRKFYKYFRNNVRQLLHTYPIDMKTKDGNLFWALPKRPPKQINDINFIDPIQQKFLVSYSILLAKIYNLPYPKNFRHNDGIQNIMAIAKGIKVQQFLPSEQQSQKLQKMTQKEQKSNSIQQKQVQQSQPKQQQLSQVKLQLSQQVLQLQIKPQQFEKDEDSNGHIDLIYSMSNLRARNYGLNECNWIQAKLKAGKIMAALSTTTSVVAALQTIQIIKLMIGSKQYRNAFANLAIPLIQISEPGQAPKHKIGNTQFTVWDTWQFKAENLKDLLKQIEDKYNVEGYNISTAGGVPIYWQKMYIGKEAAAEELLKRPLNKLFHEKAALNILMRAKQGDKQQYEHVPRIVVEPVTKNNQQTV